MLDPKVSHTSHIACVHIATAVTSISAPGTVYRMDEVPLEVRPALQSPYPTDEEVLQRIQIAVAARMSNGNGATPKLSPRLAQAAPSKVAAR